MLSACASSYTLSHTIKEISILMYYAFFCVMLQSGGAAFSSNNLIDCKPNQKRQFAQVIARRIADGLTSVQLEQDCVCKQEPEGLYAQPRCKIVGRTEKEQLAVSVCFGISESIRVHLREMSMLRNARAEITLISSDPVI